MSISILLNLMANESEYNGDQVVVLPTNFLDSVEAAVDIYANEIDAVAVNLKVGDLSNTRSGMFIRQCVLTIFLWTIPVSWMSCL